MRFLFRILGRSITNTIGVTLISAGAAQSAYVALHGLSKISLITSAFPAMPLVPPILASFMPAFLLPLWPYLGLMAIAVGVGIMLRPRPSVFSHG
jgi:hypothetical protein